MCIGSVSLVDLRQGQTEKYFRSMPRFRPRIQWLLIGLLLITAIIPFSMRVFAQQHSPHNAIIFVADGLRPASVDAVEMPNLVQLQQEGVQFVNRHSLFPTFTTANASAIATGHYLGDTGDFSNTIDVGQAVTAANGSRVPFLENNAVLKEINGLFAGNYLSEESLLAMARTAGFSTAAIGKVGPVLIQDVTQRSGEPTIVIDDATGSATGIPLSSELNQRLIAAGLPVAAPGRGDNGKPGNRTTAGTKTANVEQQQYFVNTVTQAILPWFKERQKPFLLVFWSRDPDGTQHNQGDSLNQLVPGINGPTSAAARRNADNNLGQIRAALRSLDLEATTDLFVTSDHGFSTISKESRTSYAARQTYADVPSGFLPSGFLAIDLAHALQLPLFNPDQQNAPVNAAQGQFTKSGLIGLNAERPEVIVAANGGSDLIYLPGANPTDLAQRITDFLLTQDYVSGLFVRDNLGTVPGTLPLSEIGLVGNARTPIPAIVVNFRSFHQGCSQPVACAVEIADTPLQQGQGMHGSFSRADTDNMMMAIGPDFKREFIDASPASNADVAPTLAHVLKLRLPRRGNLVGRVLREALVDGPNSITSRSEILQSAPAANGQQTLLKFQTVENTRYLDAAGFPGRTAGL